MNNKVDITKRILNVCLCIMAIAVTLLSSCASLTKGRGGLEEVASMSVGHVDGGVVGYNGRLYVWTGYTNYGPAHWNRTTSMEIYDPVANRWSLGADIPQLKSSPVCFELNGKFYTVGGETNPSSTFAATVHRYDPASDKWQQLSSFPRRIWQGSGAVCNGRAYLFGGATGYGMPVPDVHKYDPANDTWIPRATMPTGVSYPAAVSFGGKIWVFGGASFLKPNQPSVITEQVQVYDPARDTWRHEKDMPWKLSGSRAVACGGDIVIFASGVYDENAGKFVSNEYVYRFSPESGRWSKNRFIFVLPIKGIYGSAIGELKGYFYFTGLYEGDRCTNRVFRTRKFW